MGNAGLSCLGVFELAAAIQPLRGTTDLVRRLLALKRIPGIPGDPPMPISRLRRDDKRGRTEAQSLPGLFGAGDGQRWLILPRRL
jgi:hypothetical protein